MPADSPSPHTATKQAVLIDGTIQTLVGIGDLRIRSWIRVVKNLAIDVLLGTPVNDRCI